MNGPFGLGFAYAPAPRETVETVLPGADPNDSLVTQLAALYEEKQELQQALGVSTSAEIIERLTADRGPGASDSMLASLTDQLASLYQEKQELEAALGCSSAHDVVALVSELRSSIRTLVDDSRRRLQYEATLLETHERYLA